MIIEHITVGLSAYIASITDVKTRKIPNALSVSIILIAALFGWLKGVFIETVLIMAFTYCVFFLFQLTNAWGGGDSKLITGIAGIYNTYRINPDFYFLYFFFIIFIFILFLYMATFFIYKVIQKTEAIRKVTVPIAPAIYISWLLCFILDVAVLT